MSRDLRVADLLVAAKQVMAGQGAMQVGNRIVFGVADGDGGVEQPEALSCKACGLATTKTSASISPLWFSLRSCQRTDAAVTVGQ
ncbi:hypothetical protein [Montanilutibacter psychrotolerans]|uniref:hypothetical protein n=1 Tax=Montanilutibacter psychrotolerans TaxID=1327343 RepID=UPI0011CEA5D5|nr:hypothetical protein [Lysobacter psychrotolerans]